MTFQVLKERHNLDCFSFIRLVNYLRKEKPLPELIMSEKTDKLWKKDHYLKPVDRKYFCLNPNNFDLDQK